MRLFCCDFQTLWIIRKTHLSIELRHLWQIGGKEVSFPVLCLVSTLITVSAKQIKKKVRNFKILKSFYNISSYQSIKVQNSSISSAQLST